MTDPHKALADEMRSSEMFCDLLRLSRAESWQASTPTWSDDCFDWADRIEAMGGEQEQAAVEGSGPQPHGTEPHPPATPCRHCGHESRTTMAMTALAARATAARQNPSTEPPAATALALELSSDC